MLLITLNEWFFNKAENAAAERTVCIATYRTLTEAIDLIWGHEKAYNEHYGRFNVLNYRMIGVQEINSISVEAITKARVGLAEHMTQSYTDEL